MKCPKCQYVSFDDEPQCRNCGYTFAMGAPSEAPELSLRRDEVVGPLMDLTLRGDGLLASDAEGSAPEPPVPPPDLVSPAPEPSAAGPAAELPLFSAPGEAPAAVLPAVPTARPPLSVRRPTVTPRPRPAPAPTPTPTAGPSALGGADVSGAVSSRPRPSRLDPTPVLPLAPEPSAMPVSTPLPSPPAPADEATAPAIIDGPASVDEVTAASRWRASASDVPSWERRLGAVVLDLALLGTIDALIISFTSQIVGVPVSTFTRAPLIPLLGFLGLLNFAYLFSLVAAAGQTLGKMAFQLKVVSDEGHEASTGAAAVRAAAVAVTVLLGGLPFLLAFIDARGRAPHDHLAGTRVIKL